MPAARRRCVAPHDAEICDGRRRGMGQPAPTRGNLRRAGGERGLDPAACRRTVACRRRRQARRQHRLARLHPHADIRRSRRYCDAAGQRFGPPCSFSLPASSAAMPATSMPAWTRVNTRLRTSPRSSANENATVRPRPRPLHHLCAPDQDPAGRRDVDANPAHADAAAGGIAEPIPHRADERPPRAAHRASDVGTGRSGIGRFSVPHGVFRQG